MSKPANNTSRERQAAYNRLEKATNAELAQVAQHVLGYDPFVIDKRKLILPSSTRAQTLKIFKEKLQSGKMNFSKNE